MTVRALTWVLGAVAVGALVFGIAAALAARNFYFRAKIARLTPVDFARHAADNAAVQAGTASDARSRIVLLGDSRVSSWPLAGREGWRILNRGIAGDTTAQVLLRLERDALALQPRAIVVQAGINDLVAAAGMDPIAADRVVDQTRANLQEIAQRAARSGIAVIVTTILPPSRPEWIRRLVWSDRIQADVQRINQALLAWTPPEGVQVLDLATPVATDSGRLDPKFARDTLHLNPAGYRRLDQLTHQAIDGALARTDSLPQRALATSKPE